MLYCQRRPDLNMPTPTIYAYSCTHGSEFIAMEYIDGDTLSEVWMDLPGKKKSIWPAKLGRDNAYDEDKNAL